MVTTSRSATVFAPQVFVRAWVIAAVCLGSACGGGSQQAATPTLTVMNFLNWCSVAIDGDAPSTDATVTATVTIGEVATIVATPASASFEIGADPWFGVDENNGGAAAGTDVGTGTTETSTATVTITSDSQCVSVCCEEPNNSPTACPTTNACTTKPSASPTEPSPPYGY
jgi:hypothetical protein